MISEEKVKIMAEMASMRRIMEKVISVFTNIPRKIMSDRRRSRQALPC